MKQWAERKLGRSRNEERRGSGCGKVKIKCQGRPEKRGWFINASSQSQHGGTQWPYHWGSPDGVGLREQSRVRGGQSRGVEVLSKTLIPRKTQTSHSYSSSGLNAVALTHAAKEAIINYYWTEGRDRLSPVHRPTWPWRHDGICIYPSRVLVLYCTHIVSLSLPLSSDKVKQSAEQRTTTGQTQSVCYSFIAPTSSQHLTCCIHLFTDVWGRFHGNWDAISFSERHQGHLHVLMNTIMFNS